MMTSESDKPDTDDRRCDTCVQLGIQAEALYRSAFENMTDGFALHEAICNPEGRMVDFRFLAINPAFESLTGFRRDEVVGRCVTEVLSPLETLWIERYGTVIATGEPVQFESYSASLGRHFDVYAYRVTATRFAVVFRDVTERCALRERVGAMARFPSENPNPVMRVDKDGLVMYANAASRPLLDDWQTAEGRRVPRLWLRRIRKVLRLGKLRRWEVAGGERTYSLIATPVPQQDYVNVYANEISAQKEEQRKRKEAAAAAAGAQAALDTVQAMPEGVVVINGKGVILSVNPAATALTGMERGEMVGRRLVRLLPEFLRGDDLATVSAALPAVRSGRVPALPPVTVVRPNGDRVLVVPSVSFIRSRRGRRRMTVVTLKDVTDLQAANALLTRVFDNTHILIAYLDTDFTFLRVNRAYAAAAGKEPSFFVGRKHFDLYPDEENERIFAEVVRSGKPFAIHEKPFTYPGDPYGGTTYWDWSLSPLINPDGSVEGLIFCLLDVTQRKKAEIELEAHRQRLRALASEVSLAEERERRRLATELHDQASQTLTLARFKLQRLGPLLESEDALALHREALDLFAEASEQVRSFTFELSPPILYRVGLGAALDWLAERFQRQYGVAATYTPDGDLRDLPETTAVFMFQSVRELLANVGKHAGASRVTITGRESDGLICIDVKDNGKGFDPDTAEAESRKRNSFGLFSISERMQHIGGRLDIVSAPGKGTCVSLSAPR